MSPSHHIFSCKQIFFLFLLLQFHLMVSCSNNKETDICFIGDSITHLWDTDYFFPELTTSNHGVSRAVIEDLFNWDLSECKDIPSVILIGTNNLNYAVKSDKNKTAFLKNYPQKYMDILNKTGSSKYYVISILPRNRHYTEKKSMNDFIQIVNDTLRATLQKSSFNYEFINAYPKFIKDSSIIREYFSDGLHLSEEGYEILSTLVKETL